MVLKDILEKTEEYILGGWHKKTPIYTENPQKRIMLQNCRNCGDDIDLLFPPVKHGVDFNELIEDAQHLTLADAVAKINANVPNSKKNQLIDFCSGLGVYFTYGFAKRHPQTRVLMVDKLEPEQIAYAALTREKFESVASKNMSAQQLQEIVDKGFERYDVETPKHANVPRFMDELFIANNAHNMHYLHKFVEEAEIPLDKKTYCVGWNCPADAGIGAIEKAALSGAEAIAIAVSGMEHATKTFGNTILHAPKTLDYDKPEERRLGFAFKNFKALDALAWLEKLGYKTRNVLLRSPHPTYNAPEHLIYAYKEHDILA